jgi:hypothetical protein
VDVEVEDALAGLLAAVDDRAEAVFEEALLARDFVCHPEEMAHERAMLLGHVGEAFDAALGDHEVVMRRLRFDVGEGDAVHVFPDPIGRDLAPQDLAEDRGVLVLAELVLHVLHSGILGRGGAESKPWILGAAFSSTAQLGGSGSAMPRLSSARPPAVRHAHTPWRLRFAASSPSFSTADEARAKITKSCRVVACLLYAAGL